MTPTHWIIGCYIVYALYRHFFVDKPARKRQEEILAGQSRCADDVIEMRGRIVALEENPSNRMWHKKTA